VRAELRQDSEKSSITIQSCIVLALVIQALGCSYYWFFTVEDAYISFRYAENFIQGKGLVYNPREAVEGYTNFLWVVILALGKLCFRFPALAQKLGALISILAVYLLSRFGRANYQTRWIGPASALLLACCPGFQMWSVAGLETPLFIFLLIAAIVSDHSTMKNKKLTSGFCFGLSAVTRPEGILFFLLYLVPGIWRNRKNWRGDLEYLLGFALVVVPHQMFRLIYYHAWIPNSYWIKSTRFQGGGFAYFKKYLALTGYLSLPIAFAGLFIKGKARPAYLALILPAAGYLIYSYRIGGDWMPMGRFLIPALPFVFLAALLVLNSISGRFSRAVLFVFIVLNSVISLSSARFDLLRIRKTHYVDILKWLHPRYQDWIKIGTWFRNHAQPGAVLSTGLGGIIPYYSGLPTIDRGGLNDKQIARIVHEARASEEEQKQIDRIILTRKPKYILDEDASFEPLTESPSPLESTKHWSLESNEDFKRHYVRRSVRIDNRYFSFYERIGSVDQ
jgi:arabinofuranosyltransferase